ncbi:MAG: hypothetical protein HC923_12040, partial [Myxococcales bacterium]|nr:hypothetical protein [Myxococcales bacterium]
MKVSCPSCAKRYSVDDARIPPTGVTIRCPNCQHQFEARHGFDDPAPACPNCGHMPVSRLILSAPTVAQG